MNQSRGNERPIVAVTMGDPAVVATYHDQGHIPIKVHGFEESVTVTLGLPVLRTSVDHGTAFDIAWKGVAKESSMREAIRLAAQLGRPAPSKVMPFALEERDQR